MSLFRKGTPGSLLYPVVLFSDFFRPYGTRSGFFKKSCRVVVLDLSSQVPGSTFPKVIPGSLCVQNPHKVPGGTFGGSGKSSSGNVARRFGTVAAAG